MKNNLLQKFTFEGVGYFPTVLYPDFQVALLTSIDDYLLENLDHIDVHHETDEVFMLDEGHAILLAFSLVENEIREIEATAIERGNIINVPVGTWHAIVMEPDTRVFIVERALTHEGDFEFRSLSEEESSRIRDVVVKTRSSS